MKKYRVFWILILLFLLPSYAFAQSSQPPIPPAPTSGNVVLDTLNWLSPAQEADINAINKKLDGDGIAQIAVVTLNDCGDDKQKFRNKLFRSWGIGHANDNDGLLILVCWYGGDQSLRSIEQETGYGLEGTLPDILTGRMVDQEFIPAFQSNQPGDGLVAMVKQYDGILRHASNGAHTKPVNMGLAFLIIGVTGSLPGLVLSMTYSSIINISKGTANQTDNAMNIPGVFEEVSTEGIASGIYRFALAEFVSLIPILGLLYISQINISILPIFILAYDKFVFPFLVFWLIVLILFYLSKFFKRPTRNNDWDSGRESLDPFNTTQSSSTDILDVISDIAKDLPGFGGGDSGGGGSSKNF